MRILLAICCAVLVVPSLATASDVEPCAALEQAISLAEDHKNDRYAFTVHYWTSAGDKEVDLTLRYDPRYPQGGRWRLVGQNMDGLDEKTRKQISKLEKIDRPDDKIVYDKARDVLPDAEFLKEEGGAYLFKAEVSDDDLPKDALEAIVSVSKEGGFIEKIETRSLKPFKPAAVAKVNSMMQVQTYSAPFGDNPAFLATTESEAQGSAMFKKFDIKTREIYSDIERVPVSAE